MSSTLDCTNCCVLIRFPIANCQLPIVDFRLDASALIRFASCSGQQEWTSSFSSVSAFNVCYCAFAGPLTYPRRAKCAISTYPLSSSSASPSTFSSSSRFSERRLSEFLSGFAMVCGSSWVIHAISLYLMLFFLSSRVNQCCCLNL